MSYSKISILIPTRKRIDYLKKMLKSYQDTLVNPDQSEFVFRIDADDTESADFLAAYRWPVIVGPRREGYKSLPGFYNEMVGRATGDLFLCCNDDVIFKTRDWPRLIIREANKYPDGIFNIGVSVGINDEFFPFPIVSRQLVDRLGKIHDERVLFSDIFLLDVARHFNRAVRLPSVAIHHDWAGHTDDLTRQEAADHEYDEVWQDVRGQWTPAYTERHKAVVRDAVAKLEPMFRPGSERTMTALQRLAQAILRGAKGLFDQRS